MYGFIHNKSGIVKHSLQSNLTFPNIKLRDYNFLDAFEYIKHNQKDVVNKEPGIFNNSPILIIYFIFQFIFYLKLFTIIIQKNF